MLEDGGMFVGWSQGDVRGLGLRVSLVGEREEEATPSSWLRTATRALHGHGSWGLEGGIVR